MRKKLVIFLSVIILLIFLVLFMFLYDFKLKNIITDDLISVQLDKCVDGDTAWFKIDGKSKKYRFLAIDAKEIDTNDGKVASNFVCDLLSNANSIELEYDIVGETRDKYGRELVWVYVNNELIQEKILEKGFARIKYVYANYEYLENLIMIENKAINERLGIRFKGIIDKPDGWYLPNDLNLDKICFDY